MTENEAKLLEKLDELANDLEVDMYSVANLNFFFEESANTIRKLVEEIQQYRAIGTVEEFKALKEKSVAKKLKHDVCPNCSTNNDMIIKHLGNPQAHKIVYCWNCGQALDWQ